MLPVWEFLPLLPWRWAGAPPPRLGGVSRLREAARAGEEEAVGDVSGTRSSSRFRMRVRTLIVALVLVRELKVWAWAKVMTPDQGFQGGLPEAEMVLFSREAKKHLTRGQAHVMETLGQGKRATRLLRIPVSVPLRQFLTEWGVAFRVRLR